MKLQKTIKGLVILPILICMLSFKPVQPPVTGFSTVLIKIDATNEKNLPQVESAIQTAPSATVVKYCNVYKVFVVQYDATRTTPDGIARMVSNYNIDFKCEIKSSEGFDSDAAGCISTTVSTTNPN